MNPLLYLASCLAILVLTAFVIKRIIQRRELNYISAKCALADDPLYENYLMKCYLYKWTRSIKTTPEQSYQEYLRDKAELESFREMRAIFKK